MSPAPKIFFKREANLLTELTDLITKEKSGYCYMLEPWKFEGENYRSWGVRSVGKVLALQIWEPGFNTQNAEKASGPSAEEVETRAALGLTDLSTQPPW